MKYLTTLLLFAALITLGHAEMKCEAGKCTTGKTTGNKKVPAKPDTRQQVPTIKKQERNNQKPTVKQLFNVLTIKVIKKQVAPEQTNYGYIIPEDDRKTDVVAWFGGFVVELYADKRFMHVKKGEPLAKVYSPEVYKAKQDYLNALNFNDKRPSPAMVKGSRIKLQLLNISAEEISEIAKRRKAPEYTTLYAPADGWIFEKKINEGSAFTSSETLFEIVDIAEVWMEAKLYQNQLEKLAKLEHFTVKAEGISHTFKAKKSLLYPALDPKEATATLRLVIDNKEELLKPGMYATLQASTRAQERLLLPRTAVIRKSGKWYVFLATEFKGEYLPLEVKVKPVDNTYFEVLEGLKEGDEVVNNALFMMDSDAQINSIY